MPIADDETLLSMIPALEKETVGRPGARSCAPLGGGEPIIFRAFVETHRADLTRGGLGAGDSHEKNRPS
jgi:hypothetical protein